MVGDQLHSNFCSVLSGEIEKATKKGGVTNNEEEWIMPWAIPYPEVGDN